MSLPVIAELKVEETRFPKIVREADTFHRRVNKYLLAVELESMKQEQAQGKETEIQSQRLAPLRGEGGQYRDKIRLLRNRN
jgi:hypothetical protein